MKKLFLIAVIAWNCFFQVSVSLAGQGKAADEPDLSGLVEVKRVELDFAGKDEEQSNKMLWNNFANTPHEKQFFGITTRDWQEKFDKYKAKLINKAAEQGFDTESLAKCIDEAKTRRKGDAALPIGAYLARSGPCDVWIIVCKWEMDLKDRPLGFGHIFMSARRAADCAEIVFSSCK